MAIDRPVLPVPDNTALQHSENVKAFLMAEIRKQGGWVPFTVMMNGLLYAPGLGYYAAGTTKFGPSGDFVTAPEISPAFGRTLACAVVKDVPLGTPLNILEPGAGSAALAIEMLRTWDAMGYPLERYTFLETSPYLQQVQKEAVTKALPHLLDKIVWAHDVPEGFKGMVIANEVLDAMPVHLIVKGAEAWFERGVRILDADHFGWEDRAISSELNETLKARGFFEMELPVGYVVELARPADAWIQLLGERIIAGSVVLIDYGFPRREFYHPHRDRGTLMCHYRHFAHDDPFLYPGLQDVTVHVDFTQVGEALIEAGFTLRSYDTQAQYLLKHGILDQMQPDEPGSLRWMAESSALQKLLSPAEMGELFKVITAQKGGDMTHDIKALGLLGIADE